MLVDQFGQQLDRNPGAKIAPMLRAEENKFEGIVFMKIYLDALDAKGRCAHCNGPLEGVLRFPKGYLANGPDSEERIADAKSQMIAKLKKEHFCISRIEGPKLPVNDFLKRFE